MADHSSIIKFPAIRRVQGHATANKVVEITLPTVEGSFNFYIGPFYQSDGTTVTTGGVSFDQSLETGDSAPTVNVDGNDCDYLAANSTRCFPIPARGRYRNPKVFIWVATNSGFAQIRYHGDMSAVDK